MASRWRTWNMGCLHETLVARQHENEIEPLIVDGCTREIPCLDFSSIVLPKEAFFTSNEDGGVRSKGRGRSLANRALGLDKPSRRPGQRATSDKAGPTIENAEPKSLGSQFLGSGYLYEELFPSLDQSSTEKSDLKSSIPTTSVWGSRKKTKREKQMSPRVAEQAKNKESLFWEKSTKDNFKSEHSDVLHNSINQKKPTSLENFEDISEQWDVGGVGGSSSDEMKSQSFTIYDQAPAMTIDKNKTEVPGTVSEKSKGKPRSDLRKGTDISKNNDIITENSDRNSRKIDSKFNKVEFETVQLSSMETINSMDCITTKVFEELHKDKQSEHLPKKLEIDNHQNLNPEDDFQEICWIESENDSKLFAQCNNDKVNICDQLSDHLQVKDQNSTSLKDNVQETDWIESEDNLFQKWDHEEDKNSNHLSDKDNQNPKDSLESDNSNHPLQQYDNEVNTCDPLPATKETLEVLDSNEQLLNNSNLVEQQDAKGNFLPVEDTSTIIATSENNSLSPSSLEGPQCRETTDAKETLEETLSLDMSTSDVEMEPCNVLLENLPLALTEEELRDIVEPYGEMESYNFNIKDDLSKTCTIRMPNSLCGELLVVSLDGLEVYGYRIKATMEDI